MGFGAVVSRSLGAVTRAAFMFLVALAPGFILPPGEAGGALLLICGALFVMVITGLEYGSPAPAMVSFREAPPYNRLRAIVMGLCLILGSAVFRSGTDGSTAVQFVYSLGQVVAHALAFGGGPIQVLMFVLPEGVGGDVTQQTAAAGGLAVLVGLGTLITFVGMLRLKGWPDRDTSFNLWINLPTFAPLAGADLSLRLRRDAIVNAALGILMLALIPIAARLALGVFEPEALVLPQVLVWIVMLWALVPVSLFMRAIALRRIADMIAQQREARDMPDKVFLPV